MKIGLAIAALGFGLALTAQAQTPNVRFLNPPTIGTPRGYTHVVEVNGANRIIYLAGQLGVDTGGNIPAPGDFRAQATQVFENLKNALASVDARFEHVVKLNTYLTDIRTQLPIVREVRDRYVNTAAPPASTTIEISRLAREGLMIEIEAVAVVPVK